MSFGKNVRSSGPASCQTVSDQTPRELLPELVLGVPDDRPVCAPANKLKIGTAKIQAQRFISPPKLSRAPHCKPRSRTSLMAGLMTLGQGCISCSVLHTGKVSSRIHISYGILPFTVRLTLSGRL